MKTKKLLSSLCAGFLLLAGCSSNEQDIAKIGLAQIVEHDSLNTIREAMMDELEVLGYKDGENIQVDYKNAQGDANNLTSIMQTYMGNSVDMIVAIATPTAMAAAPYEKDVPVIFSAVSDPVGAGLIKDLNKPNYNITGTSDEIQVDQILDLALEIDPSVQTIGYIYNASEANSVSNLAKVKDYASKNNLKVEEATIANVGEISTAANVLCSKADIIFAPNDNTVASGMDALNKAALDNRIPVYVGADSMVMDGGFASVGINYEDLGRETARMIDQVLKGTPIANIPVKVFDTNLFTYVNVKVANQLGITIPDSITSLDTYQPIGE